VCNDLKVKNANNWKELALNTKAYNGLVSKAQTQNGVVKLIAAEDRRNTLDVEPSSKPRHKSG
jgi:hypothetical protein